MTKFVLEGGRPADKEINRKSFIEEMIDGFERPIRLLDCFFAKPVMEWQELYKKDESLFTAVAPDKQVVLELAEKEQFIEQVERANVMYLHGGTTKELLDCLKERADWTRKLEGKTVAGSSAGVNVLSRFYFGLHSLRVEEGLGLLPIKVIVHFKSDYNAPHIDWDKAYVELKEYGEDLPILTLAEGQFEVRSI